MPDVSECDYDKKEQFERVVPLLLDEERLFAVYDCKGAGTGFVAISDRRLIFYDQAFMRKRKALTSVPFNKITSVSTIDAGGLIRFLSSSELVVKTGSEEFEFDFRGGDKAERAYKLIMQQTLQSEPA